MPTIEHPQVMREWINGHCLETHWRFDAVSQMWVKYIPQSPALELEPQNDRVILPRNW